MAKTANRRSIGPIYTLLDSAGCCRAVTRSPRDATVIEMPCNHVSPILMVFSLPACGGRFPHADRGPTLSVIVPQTGGAREPEIQWFPFSASWRTVQVEPGRRAMATKTINGSYP